MEIQDWREHKIEVGTTVLFGAPESPEDIVKQTGKVTEISEPDIVEDDDGYNNRVIGYGVDITVTFPDGTTETVWAEIKSRQDWYDPSEETIFEARDDIEVVELDKKEIVC